MNSRAKRHKVSTSSTSDGLTGYEFTLHDKKKLLDKLKSNGFNVTYQMELLEDCLPGRSTHEISSLINTYRQRAKRQMSQREPSSSTQNPESSSDSNRLSTCKNSPLSQWSHMLNHVIHARNKRNDLSEALTTVIDDYSKEATDDGQKYSNVYQFIHDTLQGKCPRELSPQNSLIVMSLLKQAKTLFHYIGCDIEHKFTQNSVQNTSPTKEKDGQTSIENEEWQTVHVDDESLAPRTDGIEEIHLSDPVTVSKFRGRLGQFVETCIDLPKVKKIKSCLNPLNIPVSMTVDEANRLLEAMEEFD